jgi:hypothetical protein
MTLLRVLPIALMLCFSHAVNAADQVFTCPPTIPAKTVNVVDAPKSWVATVPNDLRLSGVGFIEGEPTSLAFLKPHSTKNTKRGGVSMWKFEGDVPEGRWLSCSYNNAVSLSQRIPDSIEQCSVTHAKDSIGNVTQRIIVCR